MTQLKAFSGELNGIGFIHAREKELSFIARAADEIAGRIAQGSDAVSVDTANAVIGLATRVRSIAGTEDDAAYAARLAVAASVLSSFMNAAIDR